MPVVHANGVRFNVAMGGAGEPLVLLHGFTGRAASWGAHLGALGDHVRTVAIDLLGHGGTEVPVDPRRYAMERCVADLAAVLDALGIGPASWLGYSLGGRVALACAVAYPARVRALVLEGASPGIADAAERAARIARDEELADAILRDGIEAFVDAWMRQPLFASQRRLGPAALAAVRAARCRNDPLGLANSLRGMGTGAQEPLWDRLPTLAVPALLVVGAEDLKFRRIAAAMAAELPRAAVAVVDAAGHTAHLENPAAFDACVLEFLRGAGIAGQRERRAAPPPPVKLDNCIGKEDS